MTATSTNTRPKKKAGRTAGKSPDKPRFQPLSSAAFDRLECRHEWLVEDVLVRNQPGVIGGPMKCLKTSVMVDLAISIGTGKPFLGQFGVPKQLPVIVFSGESGQATLQETARRIARAKGMNLADCCVHWEFDLPRLTQSSDRMALRRAIRAARAKVVFIDPLYMCLFAGGNASMAGNLFEVGPILRQTAKACLDAGATPILIHHTSKSAVRKNDNSSLTLDDLAFSGVGEFVRQWLLLNRMAAYVEGSGQHMLSMAVGGSAGHCACWGLTVDEGNRSRKNFKKTWKTTVTPPGVTPKEGSRAAKKPRASLKPRRTGLE